MLFIASVKSLTDLLGVHTSSDKRNGPMSKVNRWVK